MSHSDVLLQLLRDFFGLPPNMRPQDITQKAIGAWDSLAMVQLIADLQGTFLVEFTLDEIGTLRSYDEIRDTLVKKGVALTKTMAGDVRS
jgi:acyl carrier protein